MTTSWESACSDATAALSCYQILRLYGANTKAAIKAKYDTVETAHDPSFPGVSTGYFDRGVALLVATGLATFAAGTLAPTRTDASGAPWPVVRLPGNDALLEFAP